MQRSKKPSFSRTPPFPANLAPQKSKALAGLSKPWIDEIEFSDGTYQVHFKKESENPEDEGCWAFLQIGDAFQIKDAFCSCPKGDIGDCVHVAASFIAVYNGHKEPLHIRFKKSFWNALCRYFARKFGFNATLKADLPGRYRHSGLEIEAKAEPFQEKLRLIFEEKAEETEETSLKFSNLTEEEIELWREGKPSLKLQYRLSCWYDLAKFMMLQQEKGSAYKIVFPNSSLELPKSVEVSFGDLILKTDLDKEIWKELVPALESVDSPLPLHLSAEEEIEEISYDEKQKCLHIQAKKALSNKVQKGGGIEVFNWHYVPKEGFYPLDPHRLALKIDVKKEEIGSLFHDEEALLKKLIKNVKIFDEKLKLFYSLKFSKDHSLVIEAFLNKPHDLASTFTEQYQDWIYIENQGFYPLDEHLFQSIITEIPPDSIEDFINKHKHWLNSHEGFQTHIAGLEGGLAYKVEPDQSLHFTETCASSEDGIDFGSWVYIEGQGFFAKSVVRAPLPFQAGQVIVPSQVGLFIKMNREELRLVPGFFVEKSPVLSCGLEVELDSSLQLVIAPVYTLDPKYEGQVFFYDDYTYVKGEGFSEIPYKAKLSEEYRKTVIIEKEQVDAFIQTVFPRIRDSITHLDPRLKKPQQLYLALEHLEKDESMPGMYLAEFSYKTENGTIPLKDVWKGFRKKLHFLFTQQGLLNLEDDVFEWLHWLLPRHFDKRVRFLKLTQLELIRLQLMQEVDVPELSSLKLLEELTSFKTPDLPNMQGFLSELRPYQELGVKWLWFLYAHHFSALLCDDMGLGKTHQTMGLIAAARNNNQGQKRPFLVICPTSVIYHWEEKLQEFMPGLKVLSYHGAKRSVDDLKKPFDLLLTSYGIWRNDVKLLSAFEYEIAIFDEIQIAKNRSTKVSTTLTEVKSHMRLGLTGTPIENQLRELKTLFDIVLPGYMLPEKEFIKRFVKPIELEGDSERRLQLQRLIRPFVMRRKKEDVLLDLPEKTEEILHCELLSHQMMLYRETLAKARETITKELSHSSEPVPYIHIFAVLSALKQICDHPAVYLKTPWDYQKFDSGKWELFTELLDEAMDSGQKVVVFTQYLAMIDIIQQYLEEKGIGYASIRGSTTDRGDQVRRFNHNPDCRVFVASLQASGLGIDLTAASIVIHYDRWWNAARENQATDRVHRIGQLRGVQVLKLVTKDTFEERINQLILKKGKLMEDIVGIDDHRLLKTLTREELLSLLEMPE